MPRPKNSLFFALRGQVEQFRPDVVTLSLVSAHLASLLPSESARENSSRAGAKQILHGAKTHQGAETTRSGTEGRARTSFELAKRAAPRASKGNAARM